jgi:hypothetical protein
LDGDVAHFLTLTHWDWLEAIKAFAGEDISKAKYYPQDRDFPFGVRANGRALRAVCGTGGRPRALIALLAFAQPGSKGTKTTEPITVTGTIIPSATEEGAAASYQPAKTLVVREDNSNNAGRYVLNGPGHVVNKLGEVIQTAIKPGTRVRVYYANMGDLRMVDHVVVLD